MEAKQNSNESKAQKCIKGQEDIQSKVCCFCLYANDCQCVNSLDQHKDYLQSQEKYKTKEIPIISLADADTDPRTVVIKALDASIAVVTVRSSWRPIDTAIFTVLDAKTMGLDRNGKYLGLFRVSSLSEWRDEWNDRQLLLLKIRKYFRQDAGVDFPKHNHRNLHSYIEADADTKKGIKWPQLMREYDGHC